MTQQPRTLAEECLSLVQKWRSTAFATTHWDCARELESALSKPIEDEPTATDAELKDRQLVQRIILEVSASYRITPAQMLAKTRQRDFVKPRHLAMYLAHKYTNNLTSEDIARMFKRNEHGATTHAVKVVRNEMETDRERLAEVQGWDAVITNWKA